MRRLRDMKLLMVVASAAVLLTGCDSDPSQDRIQEKWANREALSSCGEVRLDQVVSIDRAAKEGLICLRAALDSGQGAELQVTYLTIEGDPITEYYRVTPKGAFEVYTDSTEDEYGDQRWSYRNCGQRGSLSSLNPC